MTDYRKKRRLGLQGYWEYVVSSLDGIVQSYEEASSIISLFLDKKMRAEAVSSVRRGELVLDLGSGPGTMSRLVNMKGGIPVLADFSRRMLKEANFDNKVQCTFEFLPFRGGAFDCVVSGFAVRDSRDMVSALSEVRRVLKKGGRFCFCDLGKPDSKFAMLVVSFYLRVFPSLIGLVKQGKKGLGYGSLFGTYILLPSNKELSKIIRLFFPIIRIHEIFFGASIVLECVKT